MAIPSLNDLIRIALAAGREIMVVRAAGFETEKKLDGSVVTLADRRAEAVIEAGLKATAPNIPMLGEESASAGRIPDLNECFFCVDPLDGTRGFAQGGDEFTVNIALIERGAPVLGVIYAPVIGEIYGAEDGRAVRATTSDHQTPAPSAFSEIVATRASSHPLRVVVSDNSGRDTTTAEFIAALDAIPTHMSSSIKFCRIAEGAADLYPRFGEMSEWDAAAGHAILSAAGGGVTRLDGSPLRYGDSANKFIIRGLLAYANDAVATEAQRGFPT